MILSSCRRKMEYEFFFRSIFTEDRLWTLKHYNEFYENIRYSKFKTAVNYGWWLLDEHVRGKFIKFFAGVKNVKNGSLAQLILWGLCDLHYFGTEITNDDTIRIIILNNVHSLFRQIRRIDPHKIRLADVFINCDDATLTYLDEKKYFRAKNLRDGLINNYMMYTNDLIYDYEYNQDKYYFWGNYVRPIFTDKQITDDELMRFVERFMSLRNRSDPKIYEAAVDSGRKCLIEFFTPYYLKSLEKKRDAILYRIEMVKKLVE